MQPFNASIGPLVMALVEAEMGVNGLRSVATDGPR
jgi:hypothetical protein